ncbi:MAG: hypothetical protein WCF03_18355, partial [Nitrososphaeraceae archaeon]
MPVGVTKSENCCLEKISKRSCTLVSYNVKSPFLVRVWIYTIFTRLLSLKMTLTEAAIINAISDV